MRARNIKPGFFENEDLADLDPLARILFIGLWCVADRDGRFEWRPKRIRAAILPYDECDVECLLMSLHDKRFIDMYEVGGMRYGEVVNFKRHQNPHPHEAKSRLPEKTEKNQCHDIDTTLHEMQAKCPADSLIPDSLIPDLKEEASSKQSKTSKEAGKPALEIIFGLGLSLLMETGVPESKARSILGKHAATDKEKLVAVLAQMAVNKPVDPVPYLTKAMQPPPKCSTPEWY